MDAGSDADKWADEALILGLLAGYNGDDPSTISFLKRNSSEEKRARALLAAQLRDGTLGGFAKELLALALDPHTPSEHPGMHPIRTIQFLSPARGKRATWVRDLLVIDFIRSELRKNKNPKREAAFKAAEARFNIKRSRLQRIWTTFGPATK
jgi:hypothetical protein